MDRLGIGIIGCGHICATYLELAPLFAGLEIRGLADINPEASQRRGREFDIPVMPPAELLAADCIDIVVNLTIPDTHYPVTRQALEAGKHVYTEKPLALSLDEAEDLRRIATSRNLRIGSAPDTFLGGAHQQARSCIDDGMIGDVMSGSAHVMSHGMEHWHPDPSFFFQPGGGPVLDVGPYYLANLVQLIGPIHRVAALAGAARQERIVTGNGPRRGETIPVRTPTDIHALLEFRSGARITFSASWDVRAHRHSSMELYGRDGSLFLPDPNFFGGELELAGRDGGIAPVPAWDHPLGIANTQHPEEGPLANYRSAGLAEMALAIIEDRPHRCSLDLALHCVDAMTSILAAAEDGAWVELSTSCDRPQPLGPEAAHRLLA